MIDSSITNIGNGPVVTIQKYWYIFMKWKWLAGLLAFLIVAGTTLVTFLLPRVYTSVGSIWVEEQLNILPFEDIQKFDSTSLSPQSYSQLLQSRALAARIIENLKLYENIKFAGKLSEKQSTDPANPVFREKLIQAFLKRITVRPIERTRLLEVSFSDRDPAFASEILNALFSEYIDMIIHQKYEASEQATKFLKTQIANLRAEITEDEKKLSEFGSSRNILSLSASETPAITKLAEVNKALTEATIDRVNKYDYYLQLKSGVSPELTSLSSSSPIQGLYNRYTTLSQEYAKRLTTLRPEYPEMQRLKSEIDSVKEAIQTETKKMIDSAYTDYLSSLKREQSLQKLLDQLRNEAFKVSSDAVIFNSLRIELDNKKALLESLSKRQSETDLSARLKSLEAANIWVVDKASYPLNPTSPNRRRNVLIGLLAGLVAAFGLAIGIEYLDNSVKTSKDVFAATGFPTLGVIPAFEVISNPKGPKAEITRLFSIIKGKGESSLKRNIEKHVADKNRSFKTGVKNNDENNLSKIEMITARAPESIQAESFRSIRTTILVSFPAGQSRAILITSPLSQEGKSAIVSNLGISLAQANKRVVIVDADLRKPKQNQIFFGTKSGSGLSNFISSYLETAELVRPTQFPNLFLVGSGPRPADPIELLTSEKMSYLISLLKRSFDYVLIDAPPLLAVSDAIALGTQVDGFILVVMGRQTPVPALKQVKQKLDSHNIKCLGVILNGVDLIEQDGYYSRQYYRYAKPE